MADTDVTRECYWCGHAQAGTLPYVCGGCGERLTMVVQHGRGLLDRSYLRAWKSIVEAEDARCLAMLDAMSPTDG